MSPVVKTLKKHLKKAKLKNFDKHNYCDAYLINTLNEIKNSKDVFLINECLQELDNSTVEAFLFDPNIVTSETLLVMAKREKSERLLKRILEHKNCPDEAFEEIIKRNDLDENFKMFVRKAAIKKALEKELDFDLTI